MKQETRASRAGCLVQNVLRQPGSSRAHTVVPGWEGESPLSGRTIASRGTTCWARVQRPKAKVEFRSCSHRRCAQHTGRQVQPPEEGPEAWSTLKSGNAFLAVSESVRLSRLHACHSKPIYHLLAIVQLGHKSYHKYNFKQTFLLKPGIKYVWFGNKKA